jgi:hypothetical protein
MLALSQNWLARAIAKSLLATPARGPEKLFFQLD